MMKRPLPRGSDIDSARMSGWVDEFSGYRHPVSDGRIDRWLNQFKSGHRDLARRILDCVDFITYQQMAQAFRNLLNTLSGWNRNENLRRGRWRFVALSMSAGESGDPMLHKFRLANGLNGRQYNDLFIYKSELLSQNLGPHDTVVFVDDFAGTGRQVCDAWTMIEELLPGDPVVFLILVSVSIGAREKISNQTRITVVPYMELTGCDNIFSPKCKHFTSSEKDTILEYCRIADNRKPKGFSDCGFVIVFAHNCPNNSIPILHAHHPKWAGLFRRSD